VCRHPTNSRIEIHGADAREIGAVFYTIFFNMPIQYGLNYLTVYVQDVISTHAELGFFSLAFDNSRVQRFCV
jgi:hypothetical protein